MTRTEFEQFLSSPLNKKDVTRWPDDATGYDWPGEYMDDAVQLAWEVLQEAQRREKKGDKK